MTKKKIILDVDTGSDDAVAIITSLLSNRFDVVGICTECLLPIEVTTANTLKVLNMINRKVKVYKGSECAIAKTLSPLRAKRIRFNQPMEVDGRTIRMHMPFDLPIGNYKCEEMNAASFYVETLKNSNEKYTIVATAPLTNIALALIMDDSIKESIEQLVIMGGGYQMANITKFAESNFFRDPEAAQIVLNCGVPITLMPLDATHQASLSLTDIARIESLDNKIAKFIADLARDRMYIYNATQPIKSEAGMLVPLHDALCVAYLYDESIVTGYRDVHCEVECSNTYGDGKLMVDEKVFHEVENVRLVLKIDRQKFVDFIYDCAKNGGIS